MNIVQEFSVMVGSRCRFVARQLPALAFVLCSVGMASAVQFNLDYVKKACSDGRFNTALAAYNSLNSSEKENGEGSYVAGQIYAYLNQPDVAEKYFKRAEAQHFQGYDTWGYTANRLQQLVRLQAIRPPLYRLPCRSITTYGKSNTWLSTVGAGVSKFEPYAEAYFGRPLPPITFYFFDSRPEFNSFHKELLHADVVHSWHDGTGNFNVVLFCEVDQSGRVTRPANRLSTTGDVLHEYGHALCATIYGDDFLSVVPQWFNEGIADALAAPFYDELYRHAADHLRKMCAARRPAPSYEVLAGRMYEDPETGYAFGRLMVKEILGQNLKPYVARAILDNARRSNFDLAMRTVCGMGGKEAYERVRARYWR